METTVERVISIMANVRVDDVQIHYEAIGEGFPLIMIMGLGANVDWWDPRMILELSKKFKVIMFDNRGAGRIDVSNRSYTVKLFADDTAGFMNALGISRAHVLGISMGGMIAQELALNYPEKVEKLILCSTNCGGSKSIPPSGEVLRMLVADRSLLSPEEIARMVTPLLFTKDFVKRNQDFIELSIQQIMKAPISNEAYMRQLKAIMEFDTYDRLHQIEVPTLILHGRQDVLVPFENASILAEAIPNVKVVYLDKSAHGLVEEMDKMISILLDFLAES